MILTRSIVRSINWIPPNPSPPIPARYSLRASTKTFQPGPLHLRIFHRSMERRRRTEVTIAANSKKFRRTAAGGYRARGCTNPSAVVPASRAGTREGAAASKLVCGLVAAIVVLCVKPALFHHTFHSLWFHIGGTAALAAGCLIG